MGLSRKDTGFAGRLAYVRWLRTRGRVEAESDREFAKAAGVSEAWLYKWKGRVDAPDSRTHAYRLADGLGVDRAWLLDGAGQAPEPELWTLWSEGAPAFPLQPVSQRGSGAGRASPKTAKGK